MDTGDFAVHFKFKTMANKTVIEGSNRVSASQLKDFFRQIDENLITGTIVQAILEKRNPFLSNSFTGNLYSYLKGLENFNKPFKVMSFQKIGEGIIIVYDNMREYDIYFDPRLWEFNNPKVWEDASVLFVAESVLSKKIAEKYQNLRLVQTVGNVTQNNGFAPIIDLAKKILKPRALWLEDEQLPSREYSVENLS